MAVDGLRIAAIRLACRNVEATMDFYHRAFGCRETDGATHALLLGSQRIEFVTAGAPAGPPAPSNSTGFQHCAIVVPGMTAAIARLDAVPGWSAISLAGPERLPDASGGVTAFKFRDPEGHPLEFLRFADRSVQEDWRIAGTAAEPSCLGIDHSAITVLDTVRAIHFYERLGFRVSGRHVNRGPEKARMDGLDVASAEVEVTTLMPPGGAPPHLELLCYRQPETVTAAVRDGSALATILRLAGTDGEGRIADADGHRLHLAGS